MPLSMRADVTGGNWHPPVPSVTPSPHGRKTTPANPFAKKPPQTIRRAGGGQVQLSMQRQREESATAETQSGGITMEEVLKDLRILEEQQKESELQLSRLCQAKEQRQATQAALQDNVQKGKYDNGHARAYLLRVRGILATDQRKHKECTTRGAAARSNLEGLGLNLNAKLQVERAHQAANRRQDRILKTCLRLKESVNAAMQNAHARVAAAAAKNRAMKGQEAEKRNAIQALSSMAQEILLDTAKTQSSCNHMERQISSDQAKLHGVQEEEDNVDLEIASNEDRLRQLDSEMEAGLQELSVVHDEILSKLQDESCEIDKVKEVSHQRWAQVHDICVKEFRVFESQSPVSIQDPPTVDMNLLQQSVQVELKASADERAALEALGVQLITLRQQLEKSSQNVEAVRRRTSILMESNMSGHEADKARRDKVSKFEAEFALAGKERDESLQLIPILKKRQSELVANVAEQEEKLQEEIQQEKTAHSNAVAEIDCVVGLLSEIERQHLQVMESFGESTEDLAEKTRLARATTIQLEQEKLRFTKTVTEPEFLECGRTNADLNAEIRQLLNEYSGLEALPIERDADLEEHDQVETSLKDLRAECEKRINSAIKMSDALREAREREDQERVLIQQAIMEERKRKEAARILRKKRLQEEETEVERKIREKRQRRKEKQREECLRASNPAIATVKKDAGFSATKPRDLFDCFSEASDGDTIATDDLPLLLNPLMQEKKVHWVDDSNSNLKGAGNAPQDPAREQSHRIRDIDNMTGPGREGNRPRESSSRDRNIPKRGQGPSLSREHSKVDSRDLQESGLDVTHDFSGATIAFEQHGEDDRSHRAVEDKLAKDNCIRMSETNRKHVAPGKYSRSSKPKDEEKSLKSAMRRSSTNITKNQQAVVPDKGTGAETLLLKEASLKLLSKQTGGTLCGQDPKRHQITFTSTGASNDPRQAAMDKSRRSTNEPETQSKAFKSSTHRSDASSLHTDEEGLAEQKLRKSSSFDKTVDAKRSTSAGNGIDRSSDSAVDYTSQTVGISKTKHSRNELHLQHESRLDDCGTRTVVKESSTTKHSLKSSRHGVSINVKKPSKNSGMLRDGGREVPETTRPAASKRYERGSGPNGNPTSGAQGSKSQSTLHVSNRHTGGASTKSMIPVKSTGHGHDGRSTSANTKDPSRSKIPRHPESSNNAFESMKSKGTPSDGAGLPPKNKHSRTGGHRDVPGSSINATCPTSSKDSRRRGLGKTVDAVESTRSADSLQTNVMIPPTSKERQRDSRCTSTSIISSLKTKRAHKGSTRDGDKPSNVAVPDKTMSSKRNRSPHMATASLTCASAADASKKAKIRRKPSSHAGGRTNASWYGDDSFDGFT